MPAPTSTAPSTAARILDSATNQFFSRGFHAASMKDLAEEAGVRSATLYYHFANKEEILVAIMRTTLEDLTALVRAAVESESEPVAALRAAVTTHIEFHVDRHREVFLCDAELRALSSDARTEIVALRDRYEDIFRSTLRSGRASGALVVPQVDLVTRSLLASCSGVAFWFRAGGAMTVEEVAAAYVDLFLRALQARP
jgi:AcrR family transcriptional regulator